MATARVQASQRRGSERRADIIKAAREVFLERGYSGASTDEIVKRSGGSKETIYAHFGNKLGLFRAVLLDQFGLFAYAPETLVARDLESALREFGRWHVERFSSETTVRFARAFLAEIDRVADFAAQIDIPGRDLLTDAIESLILRYRSGEGRAAFDTRALAETFLDLISGPGFYRALFEPTRRLESGEVDAHVERAVAIVMLLIAPHDAKPVIANASGRRKSKARAR